MRVIIIEDEIPAAEKLERYLARYDNSIEVAIVLQSVKTSVEWLRDNIESVDLIFMDIELLDGRSFSIFEQVDIHKPIIFTTAYDEYALKAFEVNSVAYLLKPISFPDLENALKKYNELHKQATDNFSAQKLELILNEIETRRKYKRRFMIKIGEHIRSVTTDHIQYFYAEGRNAYVTTDQGRRLIIDYKLEELEEILDPKMFFRVNRSFIVNINTITDVLVYSNSRLKILTEIKSEKEIIVSREKVTAFKTWFDGE